MENQGGIPRAVVFILLGVIVLVIFGSQMYTNIQPGQKGVKFYSLGNGLDTETTYGQGMNFYLPWNKMIVYDVKTQTLAFQVDGKDKNQVQCALAMNVIYHPIESEIGELENKVGSDYVNKLIKPKLEDIALTVIKEYTYDQIISTKKDTVKLWIQTKMKEELSSRHIEIEEIKISDIIISGKIEASIERKVEAEQLKEEQQYILERKEKEREIRLVEAKAEADYNIQMQATLTPEILKWHGILATQKLAESDNAKVVVVGSGKDGLPLILGGQ